MPADREGQRTNDPPPGPRETCTTAPSSRVTGRGPTRRRVLLTTAGAGLASIAGVDRTQAAQTTGGDELWRFDAGDRSVSPPTVVDGSVYVTSNIEEEHCAVYALDAADGREQWRWEYYNPCSEPGAPCVVDGTVFVTGSYGVCAADQETGEKQWASKDIAPSCSSPTVFDGTVFVGYGSFVEAFNAAVGKYRWSAGGGTIFGIKASWSPVAVDGTVYAAGPEFVFAFDAESGDEQWHVDQPEHWTPTVVDGTVFVSGSGVTALNAETGEKRWNFTADQGMGNEPTVVGETLFVGGDGVVYAIDIVEGEEQRRFEPTDSDLSSPTVVGDALFVCSSDGYVYALDVTDGSERWRSDIGGFSNRSSPIVVDGTLYVGSSDGTVSALDAGVRGSSEDSRVLLGTEGHHHAWAEETSADVADEFAVEIDAEPVPAIRGEPIEERVTVENVGSQAGERELRYSGAAEHFEETIELEGGESRTISVSGTFDEHHPWDEVTLTATVYEDEAELTIPVKNPPTMLDRIPGGEGFATVGVFGSATYLLKWLYDGERP